MLCLNSFLHANRLHFCIFLKYKAYTEAGQAYVDNMYAKFDGSTHILAKSGTEFKTLCFKNVAKQLGIEYEEYALPYKPQSNAKIEGFHHFLKASIC